MLRLEKTGDKFQIYSSGDCVGSLQLYDHPYHMRNCYLKLDMKRPDANISAELFQEIKAVVNRPLQVMVDSTDEATITFLTAGGFVRKRRCYEVNAGADEYIGGKGNAQLFYAHAGDAAYAQCCCMMFNYYTETHKAVNPWTAGYDAFCQSMPMDAAFTKQDGAIAALAFVEGNEIAYVCGADRQIFTDFVCCLVTAIFENHDTICFECDDCDWAALTLQSMFIHQDETSFDTYILGDSL